MAKTSQANVGELRFGEQSGTPAAPDTGYGIIYARDGMAFFQDDEGTEYNMTTAVITGQIDTDQGGTGSDLSAAGPGTLQQRTAGADVTTTLDNFSASTAPTANDDTGDGYAVGSQWYDTTNAQVYICVDASSGAAVWRQVGALSGFVALASGGTGSDLSSTGPGAVEQRTAGAVLTVVKHNYGASTAPTTGDDTGDGYALGSLWYDINNDKVYVCLDASSGAAVWKDTTLGGGITPLEYGGTESDLSATGPGTVQQRIGGLALSVTKDNYNAAAAPTVHDDTGDGYEVGSQWYDTTNDKAYVCLDNMGGAAVWVETTGGGGGASVVRHYRKGHQLIYQSSTAVMVAPGVLDIADTLISTTEETVLNTGTAGDWLDGSTHTGANKHIYIYARQNGGSAQFKLHDHPPAYSYASSSALVFTAQLAAAPGAGGTSISYYIDSGEANVKVGDRLDIWSDSTHETWLGAWKVLAINTGTNTITAEANDLTIATPPTIYLSITKGQPRYQYYAGGSTWWRCIGSVLLDASSNIYQFQEEVPGTVFYYAVGAKKSLAGGTSTSLVAVSQRGYIPPYATIVRLFAWFSGATATGVLYVCPISATATSQYIAYAYGTGVAAVTVQVPVSYSQSLLYAVSGTGTSGYYEVLGYDHQL